jgi:DNA-binding transcriptional LysR family regulator
VTFEQLRIFVAVAEAMHFTRAAEALRLTQPAVSSAIAILEASTGVRLFDRLGRRIQLTHAGTLFLAEAKAILHRVADAETLLSDLSGLRRGRLALIASQTVGTYWLPPLLGRFAQAYPGLDLHVTIGNTAEVVASVRNGTTELGIAEGTVDDPELSCIEIPGDRLVLVVGPEHPWFSRAAIQPGEIAETAWIVREVGSGTRALFEAAVAGFGHDPAALDVALTLPNGEAIRTALLASAGAAIISELVVASDLRHGALHEIALSLPRRSFRLVGHRDRYATEAERAFRRFALGG